MNKRFSAEELFQVRNEIPINLLITDLLVIPSKISEGFFRFLCPICNEFQTATNPSTNLARCFRCGINFNSIDLVMQVKAVGFIQSVNYLKEIFNNKKRVSQMLSGISSPMGLKR